MLGYFRAAPVGAGFSWLGRLTRTFNYTREDEDRDHFGMMRYKGHEPQPIARKEELHEGEHETTTTAKEARATVGHAGACSKAN